MSDMVNPYIAGAPVTEQRMFFGRDDVFQWIRNSLSGQYADHILVIHGQRRVGKTSVLKQLGNRLPERYIPVFFDLQGRTHTSLDRFLWWLAREIVRVLKQERNIEIPIPEKEAFAGDLEYFENQFLDETRKALPDHTLLLTFDEFDNLEESEVKEELARPLIDHLRRLMGNAGLNFIFSIGSSGRKLENMQAAYTEFFKTALYKKISFLSEEQTHHLVTRPVEGVLEYERAAVDRIYGIASGHPYFTQLTCHELFARCQRTEQRRVARPDVEAVLDDVVERGTVNLKFVWDEATDIEKWSLAALAQMDKADNRTLADFLRKQRVRFSETDLTSGLLHLREKDVLTSDNRFVIHLLKLWLQRNRPIEQAREELTEVNPIANRYIEIGLEFKDSGQYEKAIESFQEALAVAKDNVQAQVNIALTYMDQKAYGNAVVEFEKALIIDDEDVAARAGLCDAHLALGDAAMTKGRAKEAVQSYQRVLAINAEHTEARQRMAELSRQRAEKALVDGKDEEALSAFAEALKFTPEDPTLIARVDSVRAEKKAKVLAALTARSEKEAGAKNWEGAIQSLEEASSLAPEDTSIQKRMSEIRAAQEKARLEALLAKADAAAKSARWDEAIEAYSAALAAKPDETITARLEEVRAKQREARLGELKTQARGLARAERFDDALSAWNEYLALEPADRENAQLEIEEVKMAQALAKSYAEAQRAFAKKNYDQAVSLLKDIINQDENYKDASRLLAEAIELRRTARKWWQSRWLWGAVVSSVVLVVAWFALRPGSPLLSALTAPTAAPTSAPTLNVAPPTDVAATAPPTATAAPLPYSWARVNSGQFLPRDNITMIVVDPNDPGVIYVDTKNAGMYKSIDGGTSWQPAAYSSTPSSITKNNPALRLPGECTALVSDPNDDRIAYCGIEKGIYRTTDAGQNWELSNPQVGLVNVITISPHDPKTIFAGGQGFSISTDGGETWERLNSGMPNIYVELKFDPRDPSILFAQDGSSGSPIYRSSDEGKNWELLRTDSCSLTFDAEGYATCGFWKSYDNGTTWTNIFYSNILGYPISGFPSAIGADYPSSSNSLVYFPERGLLFLSQDNGKTWQDIPSAFEQKWIGDFRFFFDHDKGQIIYAIDPSIFQPYRSDDGGKTWESCSAVPTLPSTGETRLAITYQDSDHILLATRGSGLLVSHDGCKNWESSNIGMDADFIKGVVINPVSGSLYAGTDVGAYASFDGGQTWGQINDGLLGATVVYSIVVDKDGNVYAATPYGIFTLESR